MDITLPFQLDSLLLTLITTGYQNWLFLRFPPIGILKYTNGIFICLQFRMLEKSLNIVASIPNPLILILNKFTLSPDTISKLLNIAFMTLAFSTFVLYIKRVSSTNSNSPTLVLLEPTSTPQQKFFLTAYLTSHVRPSTTRRNRKGFIGAPCLSPLQGRTPWQGFH